MYSLVILIVSAVVSIAQARRPPEIANRLLELKKVLQYYDDKSKSLASLKDKIDYTISRTCDVSRLNKPVTKCSYGFELQKLTVRTKCVETKDSRTVLISECVMALDQLVDELKRFRISVPLIQERFREIPWEFAPVKDLVEKKLSDQEKWAETIKAKLEARAEDFFALTKVVIDKELDEKMGELENSSQTKDLCSSYRSKMDIHRKFANYYDSINASLPYYDRLQFQTARTIWEMTLLKGKCVSGTDLEEAEKFFAAQSQRVSEDKFAKFKAIVCEVPEVSMISKKECLRLPHTSDSMSTLSYLQKEQETPNEGP